MLSVTQVPQGAVPHPCYLGAQRLPPCVHPQVPFQQGEARLTEFI